MEGLRPGQGAQRGDGDPEAQGDPQDSAHERQPRPVQRQARIDGEASEDHRRARLHEVEDARHQAASRGAPQHAREVREQALTRLDVTRRTGQRIGHREAEDLRGGRGQDPKAGQPHRCDRPVQALGHAEAEADTQIAARRRRARRQRIQGRDRTGLSEPQAAARVDRPLGVLRRAVVRLDPDTERGERPDLVVGDARVAGGARPLDALGSPAGLRADQGLLVAKAPLQDRAARRVDDEVVGVDGPCHDGFPEPRARVDHGVAAPARHRIGREEHAGDRGVDHPLDDHGERHRAGIDAVGDPMRDGPVRPQGRPAASDGLQHRLGADHVEVGVLLAGEARVRQILRGRRGSHRHRRVGAEAPVAVDDGPRDRVGQGSREHCGARLARQRGERRRVRGRRRRQPIEDGGESGAGGHPPIGFRDDADARRDRQAGPEELAEVRRLAAGETHRMSVDLGEIEDQGARQLSRRLGRRRCRHDERSIGCAHERCRARCVRVGASPSVAESVGAGRQSSKRPPRGACRGLQECVAGRAGGGWWWLSAWNPRAARPVSPSESGTC